MSIFRTKSFQSQFSSVFLRRILLAFIFFTPFLLHASHIVGGEIGYRCLGGNQYEIRLSVYRDCFYGGEDAPFDDPASIGVFNARTGRFLQGLTVPLVSDDTLRGLFQDDCLIIPNDVCVHTATYLDTVTLQFIEDGYHLVYQRCCRNQTIANIVNPLETGATYDIVLTANGMRTCNSTPRFKEWPPIFICVGEPVFYDHGAVDPDGDRLVYKLCTPFTGGTSDLPKPQTPARPPYDTLAWISPTYSLNNILGSGRPLVIDERSGFLFSRPELQGQFVVGVCVEEYRGNELLSVTRRDFQYNIGMCREIGARVGAPEVQCDDLEVNFQSFSTDSDDFIWNFNYPNDPTAISLDENPTYTYPDTGRYTVQLIVEPTSICSDTMYHEIVLQNNSIDASFLTQSFDCGDSSVVTLVDQSIDNISSIRAWQWEVTYEDTTITFNDQQPSFFVKKGIGGSIRLTVESQNGCTQTLESTFQTGNNDPAALLPLEVTICEGDSIQLNPSADPNTSVTFRWRPAVGIDSPNIPNPTVSPGDTTIYTARIIAPNNLCSVEKEVIVNVQSLPELTALQYNSDCFDGLTLNFQAQIEGVDSLAWYFGDTTQANFTKLGLTAKYTYPDTGSYTVRVVVFGESCTDTISEIINLRSLEGQSNLKIDAGPDLQTCNSTITLQATTQSVFQYVWVNAQDSIIGENGAIQVSVLGDTFYKVVAQDLSGCSVEDTVRVSGKPVQLQLTGDSLTCTDQPLTLRAVNAISTIDSLTIQWSPSEGILSEATSQQPVFDTLPGTRTYKVTAINQFGCQDSLQVTTEIISTDIALSFDAQIQCDNATVAFINTSSDTTINYRWLLGDDAQSSQIGDSILFNYPISGTFNACLTIDYNVACADTICKSLNITNTMKGANFGVAETICATDSTVLIFQNRSVGLTENATYLWEFSDQTTSTDENPTKTLYASQQLGVRLTVLSGDDCQLTQSDTIEVIVLSLELDTIINVCKGNQILLNPNANTVYSYNWSPDSSLSAVNVPSPTATPTESTTYTVTISDPNNAQCQLSKTLQIEVSDGLVLGIPDVINICGQATTIRVAPTLNAYVTWTNDAGQITVGNEIIIPADYNGNYLVEAIDDIGCSGKQQLNVKNENGLNIIKPIGDTILTCENQTVLIILQNGNPNDSVQIAYFPNDRITMGDSTLRPTFFGFTDTIMTLNYEARNQFGCLLKDSLIIKIRDFEINLPAQAEVCPNAPSTINPNFNPQFTYQWSPSTGLSDPNAPNPEITISTPTNYKVTVTVGIGGGACREERQVNVGLYPNTTLVSSRDTVVCSPSLITLQATANQDVRYEWSDQSDFQEIISTDSSFTFLSEEGVQTIYVRATDTFGCKKTEFTAISTLPVRLSLPDTTSSCFTEQLTLNAINLGIEQRIDYTWSPEVLIISGQGTANPIVQPVNNTIISAIGKNRFGCADTIQTYLSLIDLNSNTIRVTADPDTIFAGSSSQLNIELDGNFFYQWLPSNSLNNSNIKDPIAQPNETTTYTVEITQDDCVGIQSVEVVVNSGVCDEPYIFVPLAFTPNNDGTNDILYVRGNPIEEVYFAVYNRWGQRVFETTDKNIGWDGTFQGRKLAPDVFAYYLEITCTNGETYFRKGDVSILK